MAESAWAKDLDNGVCFGAVRRGFGAQRVEDRSLPVRGCLGRRCSEEGGERESAESVAGLLKKGSAWEVF